MSETTFSSNNLKNKVIEAKPNAVSVQYGCSMCGSIFLSEQLCDHHISNCVNNTLNAEDPLSETSNNRARKRKLDQSVSIKNSASLFDDATSDDESDNEIKRKKVKESNDLELKVEDCDVLENPVYEATSHMISENEMLITLPYAQINESTGGHLDFSNEVAIGFVQHTEEINIFEPEEHKPSTSKGAEEENAVITESYDIDEYPNLYRDSTVKILSVFTAKPIKKDLKPTSKDIQVGQKETNPTDRDSTHTDNVENDNNKVLTLLSTVDLNKIDTSTEKEITVMDLLGLTEEGRKGGKIEIVELVSDGMEDKGEQDVELRNGEKDADFLLNFQEDRSDIQSKKDTQNYEDKEEIVLTMMEKTNTTKMPSQVPTYSKIFQNDNNKHIKNNIVKKILCQRSSRHENQKKKTKLRKRKAQKTGKISILNDSQTNSDLSYSYQEITKVKEEEREDIPAEFAVFEFYDEEEEKLKAQMLQDQKKEKAIKKRTCRHCNKLFNDPMEVLRHKRQYHKVEKIILAKEKLEPFYDHKDKTECPICFLFLGSKGYNSTYTKHLMTHSNEYNFECKICHMQFRRKDHWYNHEVRHLNRPKVDQKN